MAVLASSGQRPGKLLQFMMHRKFYKKLNQPKMLIVLWLRNPPFYQKLSSAGNFTHLEFCRCSNRPVLNKTSWVKPLKMLLRYWSSIQLEIFRTLQVKLVHQVACWSHTQVRIVTRTEIIFTQWITFNEGKKHRSFLA